MPTRKLLLHPALSDCIEMVLVCPVIPCRTVPQMGVCLWSFTAEMAGLAFLLPEFRPLAKGRQSGANLKLPRTQERKYCQMLCFRDGCQPVSNDGLTWLTAPKGVSFVSPLPRSTEKTQNKQILSQRITGLICALSPLYDTEHL